MTRWWFLVSYLVWALLVFGFGLAVVVAAGVPFDVHVTP